MSEALKKLAEKNKTTPCQDRPVPFTEVRQTPDEAKALCADCPVRALCGPLGFTESVYADDMVYGGLSWRRGLPLVSETGYEKRRAHGELAKLKRKQLS